MVFIVLPLWEGMYDGYSNLLYFMEYFLALCDKNHINCLKQGLCLPFFTPPGAKNEYCPLGHFGGLKSGVNCCNMNDI